MQTSTQKTSNLVKNDHGFTLIEIMVALLLAALMFMAFPSGDSASKHRELKTAINDIERSIQFAGNEAILRNTVVRLRFSLDADPMEYTVEYGPAGNLPLPDMPIKTSQSLAEEKAEKDKTADLDRQFTKVEEFDDIKHELSREVMILGVASTFQKKIVKQGEASIYFYPTGEKDAALIFFATSEELAYLDIQPFLSESTTVFETLATDRVAKIEDVLQTRMDEVYKEWLSR